LGGALVAALGLERPDDCGRNDNDAEGDDNDGGDDAKGEGDGDDDASPPAGAFRIRLQSRVKTHLFSRVSKTQKGRAVDIFGFEYLAMHLHSGEADDDELPQHDMHRGKRARQSLTFWKTQ
jgi:hypothetical protein